MTKSMGMVYKDKTQPVDERADDLLARMTLEEKLGQLMLEGSAQKAADQLARHHVGSFLNIMGRNLNVLQEKALTSRLGIPILFGMDAIHGHGLWKGGTVFPTQFALSSSWNTDLAEEVSRLTAQEVRATGPVWIYSPQLDLCRDIRWGRLGESFGEDPLLIAEMGAAFTRGYQGLDLADRDSILACAKHYAGHGDTIGGRDSTESEHTRRKMRMWYLSAFRRAVQAGCGSIMVAYQTNDGVPCSFNRWLLTDVLRDEWGFQGFAVTDWGNLYRAVREQFVSPDMKTSAVLALKAGCDMIMDGEDFHEAALQAVNEGLLPVEWIDRSAARILRMKFKLGLFDHPDRCFSDESRIKAVVGCAAHRETARRAAVECSVLLTNQNGLLPLIPGNIKRLAVIGPLADDAASHLGGWSIGAPQAEFKSGLHEREQTVTVLDGIRRRFGGSTEILYEKGCLSITPGKDKLPGWYTHHLTVSVLEEPVDGISRAVEAARKSDVVVLVVGDAISQAGEMADRADMTLPGRQKELLAAVKTTGKPIVAVLIVNKPHIIPELAEAADAILCAWNPGIEGGNAVAALLAGDVAPSGKLTWSWPKHLGQQPVNYNTLPGWHAARYQDCDIEPLFPFGHGLTYTRFEYANLRLEKTVLPEGMPVHASVEVRNTGSRPGTETVQCYLNDCLSSAVTPLKELKAWKRIDLAPGETKAVSFELPPDALAFVDAEGRTVTEPGDFELMIGPSSADAGLLKSRFTYGREAR